MGRVVVVLSPGTPAPPPAQTEDLGRVLSAAFRQLRALARVAGLSRRAHAHSRELDDRLKELLPSSVIAVSTPMRRTFNEVVPAVAAQSTTVLLLRETGRRAGGVTSDRPRLPHMTPLVDAPVGGRGWYEREFTTVRLRSFDGVARLAHGQEGDVDRQGRIAREKDSLAEAFLPASP
jgi:hypothetical protein